MVDNDVSESAKTVVDAFSARAAVSVRYDVEPRARLRAVRNRAVENARDAHVAFIDDDEYPVADWLCRHYRALKEYKADGVLGPVIPHYEVEPPDWVVKGRLCERETFETGTVIRSHIYTRTGNVLLDGSLFPEDRSPFDPQVRQDGGRGHGFFQTDDGPEERGLSGVMRRRSGSGCRGSESSKSLFSEEGVNAGFSRIERLEFLEFQRPEVLRRGDPLHGCIALFPSHGSTGLYEVSD